MTYGRIFFVATALLFGGIWTSQALAEEIVIDYQFSILPESVCQNGLSCKPWGEDLVALRNELHPVVPVKIARIMLPDNTEFETFIFTPGPSSLMRFQPEMANEMRPISGARFDRVVTGYDGGKYPREWVGDHLLQNFRGFQMLHVPIYPMHVMGDGTAEYITKGQLKIILKKVYGGSDLRRDNARDRHDASLLIDNPPSPWAANLEPEGYLIIGPESLIGSDEGKSPLKPLIDDKRARGLQVEMAALEKAAPQKTPEQIRAFITQKYKSAGIDYVLLIGSDQELPWKKINGDGTAIPSDQYYACLDGDFSESSSYDWACEVAVGRVGARSIADVAAWVSKTISYQEIARDKTRSITFLSFGERLDGSTLGGWALDRIIEGSSNAPATKPMPSNIQHVKVYDTDSKEATSEDFLAAMGKGDIHVVNHLGHSNSTYTLRMNADVIKSFTFRPTFVYSEGCYPNDADTDNWTIQAVRLTEYGPAAMIANTRYGWYEPGKDGEGTSALLHRNFWAMLFEKGIRQIGKMNHKAKEAVIAAKGSSLIYTALESNLIGDPELDLGIAF